MTSPVFGLFNDLREEFSELANHVLMVAGGYLVGFILGWVISSALNRWAFQQKSPEFLHKLIRHLCGLILAIIVALIVFTGKGKPTGDGGDGKGGIATTTPGKNSVTPAEATPKDNPKVTTPKLDPKPADSTIRVTILGGTAVPGEGRFYLLDDDHNEQAKNLSELKRVLLDRKTKSSGKVALAVQFPDDPNFAPPRNDLKVTDLTRWATEEAGFDVTFPASR
jgi:hypothetical protein